MRWEDLPAWERDPYGQALMAADDELAEHEGLCPRCDDGHGCPEGDWLAEAESRAYTLYAEVDPENALAYREAQHDQYVAQYG